MKSAFALILVLFLAFSAYRLTFRRLRLPLLPTRFFLAGNEYLLLGLLLGPAFLNLLDESTRKALAPLTGLVLGWIGLFFGFQFELSRLRRVPVEILKAVATTGVVTYLLIFSVLIFSLSHLIPLSGPLAVAAPLSLAAVATCSGQTRLAMISGGKRKKSKKLFDLLQYIAGLDGVVALSFYALAFFTRPMPLSAPFLSGGPLPDLLSGFGLILVLAMLFKLLSSRPIEKEELILVVMGMSIFSSGLSWALHLSPLLVNFGLGVLLANILRRKEPVYAAIMPLEKPAYLILLFMLGAGWNTGPSWFIAAGLGFWLIRFFAKFLAGAAVPVFSPALTKNAPRAMGMGMMEFGGLGLAILLDFQEVFPAKVTSPLVGMVLYAVVFNGFVSPEVWWLRLERDAHEKESA